MFSTHSASIVNEFTRPRSFQISPSSTAELLLSPSTVGTLSPTSTSPTELMLNDLPDDPRTSSFQHMTMQSMTWDDHPQLITLQPTQTSQPSALRSTSSRLSYLATWGLNANSQLGLGEDAPTQMVRQKLFFMMIAFNLILFFF
jgi:hypothetical protein